MQSERSHSSASGVDPARTQGGEQFSTEELAVVLSHYDIGVIDSVVDFPRGSRKAPKLLIVSEQGKFLLKRRAKGKDDPFKVAFTHSLQVFLASKQFPLPRLIGTRKDNNSMLQSRNAVYELFEYIPGQSYPQTLEATFESGRVLGLYHKLVEDFKSEWKPPGGSYHAATPVEAGFRALAKSIPLGPNNENRDVHDLLAALLTGYRKAAETVKAQGIDNWPKQIVHADWHPGNMLFLDNHVVGVIDYDSARLLPRIIDIANGTLQFSMMGGDEDVAHWPDQVDEVRFKKFLTGYDEVMLLSQAEIRTIPPLMVEALIAEAIFPIAATGSFGKVEGMPFLHMAQRKVNWLFKNHQRLVQLAEG